MDDIKSRLDELLQMDRDTIDRRLAEATGGEQRADQDARPPDSAASAERQPEQSHDGQPQPEQPGAPRQMPGAMQSGEPHAGGQTSGEGAQGDEQQGSGAQQGAGDRDQFAEMLKNIANRKKDFLSNLPDDVPSAVKELQNYEFMDPEARAKFQELMEMLKKAMMDTFFKDLYNQIQSMTPEQMERRKNMIRDLNQMLQDKAAGNEPNFEQFMQQYGDLFGDNPPQSLEELIQQMQQQISQMQNLLDSMPSEMRQQLQDLSLTRSATPSCKTR